MEYNIIIANKSEKKQVYRYLLKIDKDFPIALSKKVNIQEYVEKIFECGIIILAKKQDKIIAILIGYANDENSKEAYISVLQTEERYRNLGIAENLIKTFEKIAKEKRMNTIKLYTHKNNENAKKFYIKNGYEIKNNEKANYDYSVVMKKNIVKDSFDLLLTSVGRRSYLINYFKEVLGKNGEVHVSNSTDITPAFEYADKTVVTPLIYDDTYVDFLKKYCKDNKIKAIISLFDIDLLVLAKHKKEFEDLGTKVIVSDIEVIKICNDKWKTYQFLKNNGFNTVHTYVKLEDAVQDLKKDKIKYPVIIKPRWGMGSLSVVQADNEEELRILYRKAINKIQQTYLKYESNQDIEQSVLIQEKIMGQEYGLDVINDLKGNYKTTIVKEKYAMRAGETDCAKVVNNIVLKQLGKELGRKLSHIANMDIDVFLVGDKPYILEMNARFGGGYPFSHMAGVNLPQAIISWLKNEKVDEDILKEKKINILFHKDINIIELNKKEGK